LLEGWFVYVRGGTEVDEVGVEVEMDEKGLVGGLLFGDLGDGML
jgi:hypothetical protein